MKENIYIDLDEDIQSVIQKIKDSESDNLDLIMPTGTRVIQNIIDTHLLKESGDEFGKNLTIVTSDLMGKIFAERAGLAVLNRNEFDEESGGSVATQAVSTGRISDIVPRKRGVPVRKIVSQKSSKKQYENKKDNIEENNIKSKSKFFAPKLESSKKSSEQAFDRKNKGEIGAGFLKSYRDERNKVSVFKELSRINKNRRRFPFKMSIAAFVLGVLTVTLIIVLLVASRTLPKAEIIIYPARTQDSKTIEVLISSSDSKADFENGIIPGDLISLEKFENGEFQATGLRNVSEKARGKVTVYNEYSSQAQNFIASRFQSENGKIFWATKAFSVPGMSGSSPGKVEIDVVAAEVGDSYNIGPSRFTMPALKGTVRGGKIYAVSTMAMNFAKSDQAKIVSSEDLSKAYDFLKEKIRPQLQPLRQNLPFGFQLWSEAYNEELAETLSNPEVGEIADKFTASVKMIARAVVFKSDDFESYINSKISNGIEDGKVFLPGSKEISFSKSPVVDYQKGSIQALINVKYDIIDNPDIEKFKESVLNKNKKEINEIVQAYKNIERAEVRYSSFFTRKVPSNPDKVKIMIYGL